MEYTSGAVQSTKTSEMLAPILVEKPPSQADALGQEIEVECERIQNARRKLSGATWDLEDARLQLAIIRARELVHGVYGDKHIIDLKPIPVQEAVLILSLDKNESYLMQREIVRANEIEVAERETRLEYHRNRLAALRSQARLAAAEMEVGKCI